MNVSTQKTADLQATMTVEVQPEDYQEKVNKVLKDYRKRADIPGFRKGRVPASLIKKQYGKSILIDEINQILQRAIFEHIQDEKLDILGNPLPVEQNDIDWDTSSTFSFEYELGLAPDFELKVNKKIKVPYYKLEADKEMVQRYVDDYAKRFGKMTYPDSVEENAIVRATFKEVDEKDAPVEEGLEKSATLTLDSIDDAKTTKALMGKKKGDKVVLNAKKAFKKDFNLSNLLGIEEETLAASTQRFELELTEVSKLEPAPLNQALFDKVFGESTVNSEKEFTERIKADAAKMLQPQADQKFYQDVKETLLGKMKFELPEAFLKKWMQKSGEKPMSAEEVEEQFPKMKEDMRWQLIENRIIKEHEIEAGQEEIMAYTKNLVQQQMAQYGQMPEEEQINSIAQNVLQNKEEQQRITDQVYSAKLLDFFKENLKIDEKKTTFDQFLKKMK
jgi:trigger factor